MIGAPDRLIVDERECKERICASLLDSAVSVDSNGRNLPVVGRGFFALGS